MRHFSLNHFQAAGAGEGQPTQGESAHVAGPRAGRSGVVASLIAGGILLIAAIVAATAMLIANSRDRAIEDTNRELKNTAYILSEQTDRAFQALELVQRSTIERMESLGIKTREDLKQRMSTHGMYLMLKDKISGLPQMESVAVFDATGDLINFSRFWPTPVFNVAERDYFQALSKDRELVSFLGAPVLNRTTGTWSIYLTRKLTTASGELLAFVVAGMELKHFEEFFSSIALGEGSAISLFRDDGMLLARYPQVKGTIGVNNNRVPLFPNAGARHDMKRLVSAIDGLERLIALHGLARYPVVVSVSKTTSAAVAQSRQEERFFAAAGALSALVVVILLVMILRQLLRGQKQTQQLLDAQNFKLNTALDNMSHGLCMFDASARLVLCNRRYIEMYGLSLAAHRPGITLRDIVRHRKETGTFSGDVDQYVCEIVDRVGTGVRTSRSIETPDGRTIRLVNQPMENGWWIATHEDITEQQLAEAELERTKTFLDTIIENVPATIFVKNSDGRYVLINRAAERLWGVRREDIIGKTAAEIFPASETGGIFERDRQLTGPDQVVHFDEHPFRTPGNGTRIVTSTRMTIRSEDDKQQYLLGVVEDVTDRKLIERQLQQAQRMEAIGNLTGGLAHDFNNLLLIMIGNLDLLKDDVAGNHDAEEKVETILEASLRGAELTKQMLAFSRRQTLQPKRLDVNTMIDNTMSMLKRTLGETITYDLHLAGDLWPVFVDDTQLESALVNIAINARDAMPKGGSLRIATANMHADAEFAARHAEFVPGDYVVIDITDTGGGMPPEVVARIFEPFFTTKAPGQGTGLGLAMVYGFIKQSKGHISAYSEVGFGTTFKIYLPRDTQGDAQAKSPAALQAPMPRAMAGEVILAVDDNRSVRAAVVKQLKDLGYTVIEADDGKAALARLAGEKVDLLFSDVVMPGGMSGKELAEKARAEWPQLKVLLTSGFPGTSLGSDADLEIAERLLSKPYRKHELAFTVRDILDGR